MTQQTQKTNLDQFPASMHHLINYITKEDNRRLYGVGRIGNFSEVKEDQLREYPYEICKIKVVPAGGAPGAIVNADFINKKTGELNTASLWDGGEELIERLGHKLGIRDSDESRRMFWQTGDYELNNQYLERFKGVEVEGIAVRRSSEDCKKFHHYLYPIGRMHPGECKPFNSLIGIFI